MIYFGADYYPEHWPEERWIEDARLMEKAGFNVVRMGEFAWSKMEMREGEFTFDWLDKAIEVLSNFGIHVVLGTPTGSPPPWLMAKQADLFLVQQNGVRQTYGLRREYCPNHPLYHQYSNLIVTQMANHFKSNPAVIGWQIDNEFGDRCFCEICRKNYQTWLQTHYKTLDVLNQHWGTAFWSHTYTEWLQIPVPSSTIPAHNPGLALDYYRFVSDSYRAYQRQQIEIIRQNCPNHFITHNLMGFGYNQLNYFDMTEDLDFVSWDNYLRFQWNMQAEIDPVNAALSHDTMRGLKKKNYWVMEQQAGGGGWDCVAVTPKPGELRLWTYQSIAHGADGVLYFRWRTSRFGTEQFWQGILEHHGIPGRRYDEVSQVGHEIKRMGKWISGSKVHSKIAIMQSYDTRFAFQIQPNHPGFIYEKHIEDIYRGFYKNQISVDIISEKDLLNGYKVVVIPSMYVLTDKTVANLEEFAKLGGTVVFTPRTGVKDDFNAVVDEKLPGKVANLCGIEIEEYLSLAPSEENHVRFKSTFLNGLYSTSLWADLIESKGAEVIGWYADDFYAQKPAATKNLFGSGKVFYFGFFGDDHFYYDFSRWIAEDLGHFPFMALSDGIEVLERWQENQQIIFVLNHNSMVKEIILPAVFRNLISGLQVIGPYQINPYEVLIMVNEENAQDLLI